MPEVQEAARAVSPQIVLCRLSAVVSEPRAAVFEFRQIALGDSVMMSARSTEAQGVPRSVGSIWVSLPASLSGRGLRTGLWQQPFSAAHSYPALFLQRLQRMGDGSLADFAAPCLDLLGDLGGR
jgi:hypothetical protein